LAMEELGVRGAGRVVGLTGAWGNCGVADEGGSGPGGGGGSGGRRGGGGGSNSVEHKAGPYTHTLVHS